MQQEVAESEHFMEGWRDVRSGAGTETHLGVEPSVGGFAGRHTTVVTWAETPSSLATVGCPAGLAPANTQGHNLGPRLLRLRSQSSWRESNRAASPRVRRVLYR